MKGGPKAELSAYAPANKNRTVATRRNVESLSRTQLRKQVSCTTNWNSSNQSLFNQPATREPLSSPPLVQRIPTVEVLLRHTRSCTMAVYPFKPVATL